MCAFLYLSNAPVRLLTLLTMSDLAETVAGNHSIAEHRN